MTTAMHVRVRITPWDDPDFVRAFEEAQGAVQVAGLPDAIAGPEVQRLLRATGYPDATVLVERTVDEALRHASRWVVRRDA